MRIVIYAIFALSLELLVGTTGLVSLGHAAFFGIGAYATVLGSRRQPARSLAGAAARWRSARPPPTRSSSARSACARAASTSSWSRWRSRRWPTSSSTTPRLGGGSDGIYLTSSRRSRSAAHAARPRRARCTFYYSRSPRSPATYALARAAAALALRPCAGRHPRQRAAHARRRLPTYPLQARRLRARRRAGRPRRLPARRPRTASSTRSCCPGTSRARCC